MEENLHNDKLEEFLKRSLDGHSEDPPGDLWSKIAANLEPPVTMPTPAPTGLKVRFLQNWWAVAAAAAVMAGLLIGQHFYFNNKIEQLSKELEQNNTQLEQLEQRKLTETNPVEISAPAETTEPAPTQSADKQSSLAGQGGVAGANTAQKAGTSANATAHLPKGKGQHNAVGNRQPPMDSPKQSAGSVAQQQHEELEKSTGSPVPIESKITIESEQVVASNNADLQKIWLKRLAPLEQATLNMPTVAGVLPIDPLKSSGKFTVGVNAMPMVSKGKINSVKRDGPGGSGFPGDRKTFDLEMETTGQAWMAGVSFEAAVSPRLRIGTGLNYQTSNYEATHDVSLRFDDRRHNPGPPGNEHEHDFQYYLNTAVGSVEIEVRADSDDPAQNIPDDEKIEAEVSTSQRLSYVSIPFYANYSLGKGRLRALAKGGIMLNFLQDNEFTVGTIKSLNNRFDFRQKERQMGRPSDLQSVTVDYIAGVGLEYRMNQTLSLRLEPTVIGSLTSLHNNPRIESSEISAGLNVGMTYSF